MGNRYISIPAKQRFWVKVQVRDDNECWPWLASVDDFGYGHFGYNAKVTRAHRVAYELTYGAIPQGMKVLHRCDNPACCNPNHLFLGTHEDNMQDKIAKNRQARGDHSRSSLTNDDVQAIRKERANGATYAEIATKFNVSKITVRHIIKGRSWKHLPEMMPTAESKGK